MSCLAPILVVTGELTSRVACGQCRDCRVRRKLAWVGRLRLEAMTHQSSRFLTLTYAEDPGELQVSDLQQFMKRYRYHYGECRFFAVGEYGEKNARGHWHIIIFGHQPEVVGHWKNNKAWKHGFSYDGNVTEYSILYVGGYVMKWPGKADLKPVVRQSLKPGIGMAKIGQMAQAAVKTGLGAWPQTYAIGGKHYPLCAGGLLHFQKTYLELGGVCSFALTPEERDCLARLSSNLGTLVPEQKAALAQSHRERIDQHGTPKAKTH